MHEIGARAHALPALAGNDLTSGRRGIVRCKVHFLRLIRTELSSSLSRSDMGRGIVSRNRVLSRAADLAVSGKFASASEICAELRKENIDAGLHIGAATALWLNELCQRSVSEVKGAERQLPQQKLGKAKL